MAMQDSEILLGTLFLLNVLGAVLFSIFKKPREYKVFGIFFCLVPVLGFALYYIPTLLFKATRKHNFYDESSIVLKIQREEIDRRPNMEEEINIISIDAAMMACTTLEKRTLLLNVLKNDMMKNAAAIKIAMGDKDSETTHYAASAILETYKKLKANIQELEIVWKGGDGDAKQASDYLTAISDCVESKVLTNRDLNYYMETYINTLESYKNKYPEMVTCNECITGADYCLCMKRPNDAYKIIGMAIEHFGAEGAYLKGLEICLKTKNQKEFNKLFEAMKAAPIPLSNQAVELIRFWELRCC